MPSSTIEKLTLGVAFLSLLGGVVNFITISRRTANLDVEIKSRELEQLNDELLDVRGSISSNYIGSDKRRVRLGVTLKNLGQCDVTVTRVVVSLAKKDVKLDDWIQNDSSWDSAVPPPPPGDIAPSACVVEDNDFSEFIQLVDLYHDDGSWINGPTWDYDPVKFNPTSNIHSIPRGTERNVTLHYIVKDSEDAEMIKFDVLVYGRSKSPLVPVLPQPANGASATGPTYRWVGVIATGPLRDMFGDESGSPAAAPAAPDAATPPPAPGA